MSDFLLMVGGFAMVAVLVSIAIWVITALRKKPTKKHKIVTAVLLVIFVLCESIGIATGCKHDFQPVATTPATCTSKGEITLRCSKCDKSSYEKIEPLEHNLVEVERTEAAIGMEGVIVYQCTLCTHLEQVSLPSLPVPKETDCIHEWNDATCTTPKNCAICAITEGEALGHTWSDISCTSAKICSVCGETEGEPMGHKWVAATCTSPETCSQCQEQRGSIGEHKWNDATCITPKTCSVCGVSEGDALGHIKGDWEISQEATGDHPGVREQKCITCGAVIKSEEFEADPVFYSTDFGMSTKEFITAFNVLCNGDYEIKPDGSDYVIHWLGFLDIATTIDFTEDTNGKLVSISLDGRSMSEHGTCQVEICWMIFRVLNPHLSESDSMDEFKYAANSGGKEFIRGVRYLYTEIASLDVLWFTMQLD